MTIPRSLTSPSLILGRLAVILLLPLMVACGEDEGESPGVAQENRVVTGGQNDQGSVSAPMESAEPRSNDAASGEGATGTLYLHLAKEVVGRSIPSVLIRSVEVDGPTMIVELQKSDVPVYADYYEIADQRNRIIAIESVRWFRDLPAMQRLNLRVPSSHGPVHVVLDREEVADFYGISFKALALHANEDYWRENFLTRWDTDTKRERFTQMHRTE